MGVPCQKCPFDMWVYQEIIHEIVPDLIIETGTAAGGSALYLAHLCDLMVNGSVISIDIDGTKPRPTHPHITYLTGSSVAPGMVDRVREIVARCSNAIGGDPCVMVILDSDHSAKHVWAELLAYAPMVTPESYLIVEDGNVNGHPVSPGWGEGPYEAVHAWLVDHPEFEIDRSREKFGVTFNPDGYLRRKP
jgi:cephalosporin hydroxylase